MRIYEIKTIQPLTAEKARINSLKQAKDRAAKALKAERTRQKQQKAREKVVKAQRDLASTRLTTR